jgi:NADH:ubiquinone oxidoreductase subunit 4 (subunit M)
VVRVTYSANAEDRPAVVVGGIAKAVSVALVLIIIAMGLLPDPILQLATDAVRAIL